MSYPATSTASATSDSSPAAMASRSSPSAVACSTCLHPTPPILLPTLMTWSSNLPEFPCLTVRPVAEGACSSWGASSRESHRHRRIPHDHCSLGSTSSTAKTVLSLIRDTCVHPRHAASAAAATPTPAVSPTPPNRPPAPVRTASSDPLASCAKPPAGKILGRPCNAHSQGPDSGSVQAIFWPPAHRDTFLLAPSSSPAPLTKKCSYLSKVGTYRLMQRFWRVWQCQGVKGYSWAGKKAPSPLRSPGLPPSLITP